MDFDQLQIGDFMSRKVFTVPPEGRVTDHAKVFTENRIHHAPVVDKHGKVHGMLSSNDIASYYNIVRIINSEGDEPVLIKDIMSTPIFSYYEDVSLQATAQAMLDNHLHAVVVMDRAEKMIGIITSTDLLRFIASGGKKA